MVKHLFVIPSQPESRSKSSFFPQDWFYITTLVCCVYRRVQLHSNNQTQLHQQRSKELFCKELHIPGGPNSRRMAHGSIMMKVILLCAFRSNVIFPFLLPCLDMRRSCPSLIHTMGLFLLVLINVYQYLHFVYACSVCMNCLLTRMSCGTGCTNVMSFFSISSVYTALANNRVGQKTILFDHKF